MELKYSDILKNQPIFNIGSIGHVAHGKSTLVRSITGIKTQKHSDEQERNITINIGYANTKIFLDSKGEIHTAPSKNEILKDYEGNEMKLVGHISFVDVPGHEAYMANMISGSAVMDACILVIASNEKIPQAQTYEHFQAVKNVDIKDFIILQNKLDLVDESSNTQILQDIGKFVNNTIAENAKVIPSSIQNDVNRDEVIKNILNLSNSENISQLNEKANNDLKMIVIRSFDINKPNINFSKIEGGVVGGSLLSGHVKVGDYVEMRPGYIIDGKYRPIYSKVLSLQSDTKKLDYALPGGLVGICLDIDPSIAKSNSMVGQILGHVGKLPKVYNEIFMSFDEINRHDNFSEKFKTNEGVLLNINSMNIKAKVAKCKNSKKLIAFILETPVCVFENQKIAIFKLRSANWLLYATGTFKEGEECQKSEIENDIYEDLLTKNNIENINIVNDFTDFKFNSETYDELLKNVTFKKEVSALRIDPPIVKKVNRDSIFINYTTIIEYLNKNAQDLKYDSFLLEFIKDESSTTCDLGKNGLAMRGKFMKQNIQNILMKFLKKYKQCNTCNSFDSYLLRENRIIFKKCLNCNSQFSI